MITLPIPLLWLALAVAVFFLSLLFAAHVKSKRLAKRFATCSAAVANAQLRLDQQIAELKQESERVRNHYETDARRVQSEADTAIAKARAELEQLRKFGELRDDGGGVQRLLTDALKEATALRSEAQALFEQFRTAGVEERSKANERAKEIRQQADALLDRATRDAGRIVEEAHKRAEQIGGDAYVALRDKERLEQAVTAIRNVIEGYGDRYIIPTRSLIDDLASDFGHTEAGQALTDAREQSRRMVEEGQAAGCEYVEANRRETAIRFVVDAFNGRVDAILTRTKHDNYGTLEQEVRDAFALVNQNGKAFRDARILPAYLDARLAELKRAVVVQELKLKEREEQRRIKEQMREEEKARREYERVMQEAQQEEEIIKKALDKARLESEVATAEQKASLEEQVATLSQKLAEAEAKNQRAISMAQQTRKGNVYIISNVGSFGGDVFKIGMTRRLEPLDRIKELGDASVPFAFDIHAMISSDDAPALENMLQTEFDDLRVNRVNYRKEFFRLPVERLRTFLAEKGIQASFTMAATAHEYRETQALNKMSAVEREKYIRQQANEKEGWAN
jgi:hypothetical protein